MQCVEDFNDLTVERGTYVLILKASAQALVKVASLGQFTLSEGYYAYVGSAKVGIRARVGRHLRLARFKVGRLRWHIDYVLVNENIEPYSLVYVNGSFIEHGIAQGLLRHKDTEVAVRGFGSSDGHCVSHFFKWKGGRGPYTLEAPSIRKRGSRPC